MTEPSPTYNTANGRNQGTVRWFNRAKGFGFIDSDSGQELFAHYQHIEGTGYRNLYEGDRVSFGVRQNGNKGLLATDIRQIGGQ